MSPCDPDSIDQVNNSLKELIGGSCHSLMDTLCRQYIETEDYSQIWDVVSKVQSLEKRVRTLKWQNYDDSTDPTKETWDRIRFTEGILEDLLMRAMEGENIAQMYSRGVLLFQNYSLDTMY